MSDATKPRLPPGQIITRKWPVLHYGTVPTVDLSTWRFKVGGAVERPFELGWEELNALPKREVACDIHCVTRWSRYDNVFGGVPVQDLLRRAGVRPEGRFALVHAEHGFTTNLPLEDLDRPENLLALTHDGEPLTPEHGGPVRLPGAAPLFLEEREVGERARDSGGGLPRLLGAERLPHARGPLGGGAVRAARSGADEARSEVSRAALAFPTPPGFSVYHG